MGASEGAVVGPSVVGLGVGESVASAVDGRSVGFVVVEVWASVGCVVSGF